MSNEPYQQISKPEPEDNPNVININEQPPMAAQQPMLNPPLMAQQPTLNPPFMAQQPVVMVNQPPMGQGVLYPQQQQPSMLPNGMNFVSPPPKVDVSKGAMTCIISIACVVFLFVIGIFILIIILVNL